MCERCRTQAKEHPDMDIEEEAQRRKQLLIEALLADIKTERRLGHLEYGTSMDIAFSGYPRICVCGIRRAIRIPWSTSDGRYSIVRFSIINVLNSSA